VKIFPGYVGYLVGYPGRFGSVRLDPVRLGLKKKRFEVMFTTKGGS